MAYNREKDPHAKFPQVFFTDHAEGKVIYGQRDIMQWVVEAEGAEDKDCTMAMGDGDFLMELSRYSNQYPDYSIVSVYTTMAYSLFKEEQSI